MKKLISVLAVTVLMVFTLNTTVLAHGGHGNGSRLNPDPKNPLCTVEGCKEVGLHQHDGNWYCDQSGNARSNASCPVEDCALTGWHKHSNLKKDRQGSAQRYPLCTVEDCAKIGAHMHDEDWYCSGSGRTENYDVCTVEGCAEFGLHQHDGVYYYCQNQGTGQGLGHGHGRGHHR